MIEILYQLLNFKKELSHTHQFDHIFSKWSTYIPLPYSSPYHPLKLEPTWNWDLIIDSKLDFDLKPQDLTLTQNSKLDLNLDLTLTRNLRSNTLDLTLIETQDLRFDPNLGFERWCALTWNSRLGPKSRPKTLDSAVIWDSNLTLNPRLNLYSRLEIWPRF